MPNDHSSSETDASVADEFIERMGFAAQADGLSRIAGRVMGLMIIEGGPFSFSALASRLKVSRGSISTNTRLLEQLGIIERVSHAGERQDYFRLAPDPYVRLLRGSIERMTKARELVRRTKARLPTTSSGADERLDALDSFYKDTIEGLGRVMRRVAEAE